MTDDDDQGSGSYFNSNDISVESEVRTWCAFGFGFYVYDLN